MTKDTVAAALDEIGILLALQGENDFKTRAYGNAARLISQLDGDLADLVATKKIGDLRGIGDALQEKITTLVTTGKLQYLEDLRATVPPGLVEMLRIPTLGTKKVKLLHDKLKVSTLAELQAACDRGEVATLAGFGAKTQQRIIDGIRFLGTVGNRVRVDQAAAVANVLLERLRKLPGVIRAEVCGSVRRRKETSKDIDILVSAVGSSPIMSAFCTFPEVTQIVAQGPTKSSIVATVIVNGKAIVLGADLRVVSDEQFPFAVVYFTGSKEHNIRLRQKAIEMGLSLNEYALTGPRGPKDSVKAADEVGVYKALGLPFIEPELREDTGEIEAALAGSLPQLVEASQIRGVFHNHTLASDGTATLEQMALAAKSLGYEYFGVGDHSQSLTVANGLTPARVRAQWKEIDALNATLQGVTILKGTECDILADGSLDFDDELLAGFDYVVASVHSLFQLPEAEQTARVCKALSHPATTMLGHATGRLLLRREPYKIDLDKVLKAAAEHGKMIEINAQPDRLDLDWTYVKRAKAMGIPIVINPDAHAPDELALVPFGVNVARRGWLAAADVFNTKSLTDVMAELKRRKSAN